MVELRRLSKLKLAMRALLPAPKMISTSRQARRSGHFNPMFYRAQIKALHPFWRIFPMRHYWLRGERMGLSPSPNFCPLTYLKLNPDVAQSGMSPLWHFLQSGQAEGRPNKATKTEKLPSYAGSIPRFDPRRERAPYAVHLHLYYPDLWPEFAQHLSRMKVAYDLYVTLTWRGAETEWLTDQIKDAFPNAQVFPVANRGRDILPFVSLVNAGAFDGYDAVCKLHGKKSPHRDDGDAWRQHLVEGILPSDTLPRDLSWFLSDNDAAFWVADGQAYPVRQWWGSNRPTTDAMLRRVELNGQPDTYVFPAGSIYWLKPLMIGMIKGMKLTTDLFEVEEGQIDGTLAHAFERGIGAIAAAAGQKVVQTADLKPAYGPPPRRPSFVSAFYLPQFHPIEENDAWWGPGYTEWSAVARAGSVFPGHLQPAHPADLGFYDLRLTEVMGDQARLAQGAGIDAFCVYHYWFGGDRLLESPLDRLLNRPGIAFPFYLCWANESWRRNWDGLSGEVLMPQDYAAGFERHLVSSTLPYMADPRYQRPDGHRPRFVIYRPEDLPDPVQNIARLRRAWRDAGVGEVELGAVSFHLAGPSDVPHDLFDFWIEMPPHGLVASNAYLFGGADGNLMGDGAPGPGFNGLIYDYQAIARRSTDPKYRAKLPDRTIPGIMPSWDNTARRKNRAHIAKGANPATFRAWLTDVQQTSLQNGYRGELFINAWNEWAEKAMLEPCQTFGRLNLDVLAECICANALGAEVAEARNA
ncbi:glycoside hydrolase family 99-like domain-containing protein [Pseudooceanicola sp. MF1-13]|uniref:glycoside hydrolase family 99-like domain-containing protein n=1 Tax=Pseudooceanicola sp. MF1-13 TaxID=3379095 RepID=UPI003892C198